MRRRVDWWLVGVLVVAGILRLWRLGEIPAGLYHDEMDVGYQAYSLLSTGRDYFGNWWPVAVHSFADYRAPFYIYLDVPFVAVLGLTTVAVRLPAAMVGILGVGLIFLVAKEIWGRQKLALFAALLLAISPWHLQYSRIAFEATLMGALYLAGVYFGLLSLRQRKHLPLALAALGLAIWAYNPAKLFVPLTLAAFLVIFWGKWRKLSVKTLLVSGIVAVVVMGPVFWVNFWGKGGMRFGQIAVWGDPTVGAEVDNARLIDGVFRLGEKTVGLTPTLLDKWFHNKWVMWFRAGVDNYLEAFSSRFLFSHGDVNLRHAVPGWGEFYFWCLPLVLWGLYVWVRQPAKRGKQKFLWFWLVAAPIPAAVTQGGGGHATRLFLLLPVLVLAAACGVEAGWGWLARKGWVVGKGVVAMGILVVFSWYWHDYLVHYPLMSERVWQAGLGEAVAIVEREKGKYDRVVVDGQNEDLLVGHLFYTGYLPAKFQEQHPLSRVELNPKIAGIKLGNVYLLYPGQKPWSDPDLGLIEDGQRTLLVLSAEAFRYNLDDQRQYVPSRMRLEETVRFPSGEPAYFVLSYPHEE